MTLFPLKKFIGILWILHLVDCKHLIKIGALFHEGEHANYVALRNALEILEEEQIAPTYQFRSVVQWLNGSSHSYRSYEAVCQLIENGVAIILGPADPTTSSIVSDIASKYQIPHIEYTFRRSHNISLPSTSINIYPDGTIISEALLDFLYATNWKQFTILYESDDGLSRLEGVLTEHSPSDSPVTVRHLRPSYDKITSKPDYRSILKEVANSSDFNVILDVESPNLGEVIQQANDVKLLQDYYNYFVTNLHSRTDVMERVLNRSSANVTVIQLLDDEAMTAYKLPTIESALIFDAVFLINDALEVLEKRISNVGGDGLKITPPSSTCRDTEVYEVGPDITSLMKEVATPGRLSGPMIFREDGRRSFKLTFREFRGETTFESGYWEDGTLTIVRTQKEREAQSLQSIEQRIFRVTTKLGDPYVMEVADGSTRGVQIDNKRYEGYAFDLIDAMAQILKFQYTFELVPDISYGKENKVTKQWDGLIGRLLNREADLAVCDLTITEEREKAVDFTMPFMGLGISILFVKPEDKQPELFSFLSPFSSDVWIYMATAYVAVSVLLFVQARMAPEEWDSPHPCNSDPEELENNFNLMNSLWLTAGSLMQQGSDILPRAPSIRMVAGMWWFFVLIMVSSYTANLAAFLTATKMDVSISSVKELADQTKIKYGLIKDGSTAAFFKGSNNTLYQKMWATMNEAKPSVFTKTNLEGVERVAKGKHTYAFLMESSGIEYNIERNCDLMKVGDLLDNKGYGIALPPNSPYRTQFSEAILNLQEHGILRQLKDKWWLKDSKQCSANQPEPSSGELTMAHVGGVFLVLLFGLTFGVFFAIFECIWNVRKISVEEKITPMEALIAELKFAMNVTEQTKPVKIAQSSHSNGDSSTEEFIRETSVECSTIGSFLRLDKLGKREKINDL